MNPNWLEPEQWKRVQETVPVTCVDVVPIRRDAAGRVVQVGLIYRDTPHQGQRWCVVGGRLCRNESFAEAIARQIRDTLGDAVRFRLGRTETHTADADPHAGIAEPHHVAQYFTFDRGPGPLDPRQHAIGLTWAVEILGEAHARGEAVAFQWFEIDSLPRADQCGFGQNYVVAACLNKLGVAPPPGLTAPAAR